MPPLITTTDHIFVAGHLGMAGSAICRALQRAGYPQILTTKLWSSELSKLTANAFLPECAPRSAAFHQ